MKNVRQKYLGVERNKRTKNSWWNHFFTMKPLKGVFNFLLNSKMKFQNNFIFYIQNVMKHVVIKVVFNI